MTSIFPLYTHSEF